MSKIILLITMISFSYINSQEYLCEDVISTAKSYLQNEVNDELIKNFVFNNESTYVAKLKSGKIEWLHFKQSKKTKGEFLYTNTLKFDFRHSDYKYYSFSVSIELNNNLELVKKINIDTKIPQFLLDNKLKKWISESDLVNIIKDIDFKTGVKPIEKTFHFDNEYGKSYWKIINTIKVNSLSDRLIESYDINAVTGELSGYFKGLVYNLAPNKTL